MSEGQNMPQWGAEPPVGGRPHGEPASVGSRFLAKLIDGILIGIVGGLIVLILFGALLDVDTGSPFSGASSAAGLAAAVLGTAITIAYYAWFESTRGQTVGKMILKIAVRGPQGQQHPPIDVAVKRNLWMALSIVPIVGGLAQLVAAIAIAVTINSNRNGSGWHDDFAGGTRVVKV